MSDRNRILIVLLVSTALLGEVKLNPFGDSFRFSLGIVAYFFGLLWFSVPILSTGLLTGAFVVLFRTGMDVVTGDHGLVSSFVHHLPTFIFYLVFAVSVKVLRLRKQAEFPIRVGLIGGAADTLSNVAELGVRLLLVASAPFSWKALLLIAITGLLRSFFVVGLYNMLSIRQVRELGEWRKQELEKLVLLNSSLYEESFYMRKLMDHVEKLTRESYRLYQKLIDHKLPEHREALHVAENVHELKKDLQRIVAGLSKLMKPTQAGEKLGIAELCRLAVQANETYAEARGRRIVFRLEADVHLFTNQTYALLSILNNLMANAVEAIAGRGAILLEAELAEDGLVLRVSDDGPGISEMERDMVFVPGYSTKFSADGYFSTGIGLTHARDIAQAMGGTLTLLPGSEAGARFELRIPIGQLMRKGDNDEHEAVSD
ncbi:sensor histidine kinase [Paenibacillus sp. HJGM_3]|uniref:sensor histidine kinase n=1 Tax=Paenibacillus sp. HJGM_3 TaxID=3379816 RepID=UPI00385CCB82